MRGNKDINFIKHIGPQIKEKALQDKLISKQKRYEKIQTTYNVDPYSISLLDIGIISSIIKRLKP